MRRLSVPSFKPREFELTRSSRCARAGTPRSPGASSSRARTSATSCVAAPPPPPPHRPTAPGALQADAPPPAEQRGDRLPRPPAAVRPPGARNSQGAARLAWARLLQPGARGRGGGQGGQGRGQVSGLAVSAPVEEVDVHEEEEEEVVFPACAPALYSLSPSPSILLPSHSIPFLSAYLCYASAVCALLGREAALSERRRRRRRRSRCQGVCARRGATRGSRERIVRRGFLRTQDWPTCPRIRRSSVSAAAPQSSGSAARPPRPSPTHTSSAARGPPASPLHAHSAHTLSPPIVAPPRRSRLLVVVVAPPPAPPHRPPLLDHRHVARSHQGRRDQPPQGRRDEGGPVPGRGQRVQGPPLQGPRPVLCDEQQMHALRRAAHQGRPHRERPRRLPLARCLLQCVLSSPPPPRPPRPGPRC